MILQGTPSPPPYTGIHVKSLKAIKRAVSCHQLSDLVGVKISTKLFKQSLPYFFEKEFKKYMVQYMTYDRLIIFGITLQNFPVNEMSNVIM